MHSNPTKFCRVCGLEQAYPQYGENGNSPTYEICDCCGVEFGYEDITVKSTILFRKDWIALNKKWFCPGKKPKNWSWKKQKKQIPYDFRDESFVL